jgi:hypothetical protein
MRQVFSSPRLENVERVAELLREQGIEVRVTNGRSYKGARRGNFSYRESANEGPQPAVWVVKSDDQPQARQILREAGLLDSGRSPTRYLDVSTVTRGDDTLDAVARRRAFRIRAGLMLGIAIALAFGLMAWHRAGAPTAPAAPPRVTAASDAAPEKPEYLAPTGAEARYVVATPSALAALLIDRELQAAREAKDVCVSVDGADPSQTVLAQLKAADGRSLAPRSACADVAGALAIAVRDYRTDGSGGGAIDVAVTGGESGDKPTERTRRFEVRRDGDRWNILGPATP